MPVSYTHLMCIRDREGDEAQQLVAALDQPVKAGLLQSQLCHEHGLLVRVVKLGNVGLKLCADGQNLAARSEEHTSELQSQR